MFLGFGFRFVAESYFAGLSTYSPLKLGGPLLTLQKLMMALGYFMMSQAAKSTAVHVAQPSSCLHPHLRQHAFTHFAP